MEIIPEVKSDYKVLIYDVNGSLVLSYLENNAKKNQVSTANLASSIYNVQLMDMNNGKSQWSTVIKK
ncbi:MAG: hypothetical protein ACI86M_001997 [Saprospiraceae bacterium]